MSLLKMRIVVHNILIGDVEDPELYAAAPILEWEKTEKGRWLLANSYRQMEYNVVPDPSVYSNRVVLYAWLTEEDYTFYQLKWG